MRIKDLKGILDKNQIPKVDYSLTEEDPPLVEVVVCLRRKSEGFDVFVVERNKTIVSEEYQTEEEACKAFLKLLNIAA